MEGTEYEGRMGHEGGMVYDAAKEIADQRDCGVEWVFAGAARAYVSAQVRSSTLWRDPALLCSRST